MKTRADFEYQSAYFADVYYAAYLKQRARKEFYNSGLESDVIKENFYIESDTRYRYYTNPQRIETTHGITYFGSGDLQGNLDTKSKAYIKKSRRYEVDMLLIKPGSMVYRELLTRGFYHYNPHRSAPDSIIALKRHRDSK